MAALALSPAYCSSISDIRSTAIFQLSCCLLLRPSRASITTLGKISFHALAADDSH
jgi:hypothetical protein